MLSIPQAQLDGLAQYKYASIDKSFITKYFMKPYWDFAITLFPLWIAPNLITLIGFGFILINFFTMLVYMPDLATPAPSWVYLSFAIGLHLYQTFDNVDGRQARRTGSSSPLGELFDHGCDALNITLSGLLQAATVGVGFTWQTVILLLTVIAAFYFSTWEEYHTHVLQFGYINGPTEGILMGTLLMLITGIYGPWIWKLPVVAVIESAGLEAPAWIDPSYLLTDVLLAFLVACLIVIQIPTSVYAVYEKKRSEKKSILPSLLGLTTLWIITIAVLSWLSAPDTTIIKAHLVEFLVAVGFCFGRYATKMITAYVTQDSFPWGTVQLLPLIFGAINANLPVLFGIPRIMEAQYEGLFVQIYMAFTIVAYGVWAHVIIRDFCRHLKIKAFTIPLKPKGK